jgi:hypothetical protein
MHNWQVDMCRFVAASSDWLCQAGNQFIQVLSVKTRYGNKARKCSFCLPYSNKPPSDAALHAQVQPAGSHFTPPPLLPSGVVGHQKHGAAACPNSIHLSGALRGSCRLAGRSWPKTRQHLFHSQNALSLEDVRMSSRQCPVSITRALNCQNRLVGW